jgi:hypothetical protein
MAKLGIRDAFAAFGATLHNVNWSVSAWNGDDELVVSMWAHHYRPGLDKSAEYHGHSSRWQGPGKNEFVRNVQKAFDTRRPVRLVIVSATEPDRVEAGEDASKLNKEFYPRPDLVGSVVAFDGDAYTFRFTKV